MTLRERAEAHLRTIDTQLAAMRQQAAGHAQEAARLSSEAEQLQRHREEWWADMEADAAKSKRKVKSDG